jgi:hypothetical protein
LGSSFFCNFTQGQYLGTDYLDVEKAKIMLCPPNANFNTTGFLKKLASRLISSLVLLGDTNEQVEEGLLMMILTVTPEQVKEKLDFEGVTDLEEEEDPSKSVGIEVLFFLGFGPP